MKEHPILFSGPMVAAILEGRKTKTRRVVRTQPVGKQRIVDGLAHVTHGMNPADDGAVWYVADCINPGVEIRCPYGSPGDRLWVREKFQHFGNQIHMHAKTPHILYADGTYCDGQRLKGDLIPSRDDWTKWRPPIHMPRWASRITLEVVNVRVERLNEISAKDIIAEGVVSRSHNCDAYAMVGHNPKCPVGHNNVCYPDLRSLWVATWDSINGNKHPWSSNPWVWVVEFKRIKP